MNNDSAIAPLSEDDDLSLESAFEALDAWLENNADDDEEGETEE